MFGRVLFGRLFCYRLFFGRIFFRRFFFLCGFTGLVLLCRIGLALLLCLVRFACRCFLFAVFGIAAFVFGRFFFVFGAVFFTAFGLVLFGGRFFFGVFFVLLPRVFFTFYRFFFTFRRLFGWVFFFRGGLFFAVGTVFFALGCFLFGGGFRLGFFVGGLNRQRGAQQGERGEGWGEKLFQISHAVVSLPILPARPDNTFSDGLCVPSEKNGVRRQKPQGTWLPYNSRDDTNFARRVRFVRPRPLWFSDGL
ncbi:hypothetical protein ACLD9W_03910 [Neisseria sp. WLZKY-1]|uniref:hypothetical protein n=1 Tax=Neisseria sp. WLZKY-1 TaxID=3390377 RepID=UPI00397D6DAE